MLMFYGDEDSTELGDTLNQKFFIAATNGFTNKEIGELLDQGADINCRDELGQGALASAAYYQHHDAVEYLIRRGANVNLQDNQGPLQNTPLIFAAWKGSYKTVELLVNKGARLNKQNAEGNTALMQAIKFFIYHKNTAVIELLLKRGSDTNIRNHKGQTAMMMAESVDKYSRAYNISHLLLDYSWTRRLSTCLNCCSMFNRFNFADTGKDVCCNVVF
jgi:ankyrin repeat protein